MIRDVNDVPITQEHHQPLTSIFKVRYYYNNDHSYNYYRSQNKHYSDHNSSPIISTASFSEQFFQKI